MTSEITHMPLDKLHFGHECPSGNLNSRRTDRDRDIPKFARNLATFGLLLPLLTKKVEGKLYVAAGNRRLAALHYIFKADAPEIKGAKIDPGAIPTLDIEKADGLELSLIENTEREPLHPVDRFEVFSALKDDGGLTVEQIAARHGITKAKVEQAFALGALSEKVRAAWRSGEVDAETAKAFTLTDARHQEKILAKLRKAGGHALSAYYVKNELGTRDQAAASRYVNFVGVDAYKEAGGKLSTDLFGSNHIVHDPKIATELAQRKLSELCDQYTSLGGWKWCLSSFDAPPNAIHHWQRLPAERVPTKDQARRIEALEEIIERDGDGELFDVDEAAVHEARVEWETIDSVITEAAHKPAARGRAGCILSVSESGVLLVTAGLVKTEDEVAERKDKGKAAGASNDKAKSDDAKPKAKAEPSNALLGRLATQQAEATRAALVEDAKGRDELSVLLAKLIAIQIEPDRLNWIPPIIKANLDKIRSGIDAKIMTAALCKAFDEADYFASAPKTLVIKAIKECAPTMVGQAGFASKPKGDLAKIALGLVGKHKWLPPELRLKGAAKTKGR